MITFDINKFEEEEKNRKKGPHDKDVQGVPYPISSEMKEMMHDGYEHWKHHDEEEEEKEKK